MKYAPIFVVLAIVTVAGRDVQDGQYAVSNQSSAPVTAAQVQIFEGTPDRTFTVDRPVDNSVNKLTALHPSPSREATLQRLKEAAAKLGADAVINTSVGEVKVVPLS
jgi:hypothetical protein